MPFDDVAAAEVLYGDFSHTKAMISDPNAMIWLR